MEAFDSNSTTNVRASPLSGFALSAAEYVSCNPGRTGEEISAAIGCSFDSFRKNISPKLAAHGIKSRNWGGGGYYASNEGVTSHHPQCDATDKANE